MSQRSVPQAPAAERGGNDTPAARASFQVLSEPLVLRAGRSAGPGVRRVAVGQPRATVAEARHTTSAAQMGALDSPALAPDIADELERTAPAPIAVAAIDVPAIRAAAPLRISDLTMSVIEIEEIEVSNLAQ